jgi:fructose-bisphosphate aldolase class II
MIVTTNEPFPHAYGKYAVGAYNINNLEQTVGLFRGDLGKSKSNEEPSNPARSAPFIIQISRGARSYSDKRFLEAMIRTAEEVFPEAIFAVHLDHGTEEACYDCIASGFYSSVMIDASHEPFEKNIEITRRIADKAHAKGIVVEAELGQLGGVEEDIVGSVCLTDARPGRRVRQPQRLRLAGRGHRHLARGLQVRRLAGLAAGPPEAEIQKACCPGASPGDARFQQRAQGVGRPHQQGGRQMKNASGVSEDQYLPAARLGICKVNIDTDGRLVWCAIHREAFRDDPANFDLRPPGKVFMAAYAQYIIHKNQKLGSAGQLEAVRGEKLGLRSKK